jgi:endonuclease G, mitochondrial
MRFPSFTNQGKVKEAPPGLKLWGNLEDHVASQGKKNKRKLCVFNGPVFRSTDQKYRGVQIPREFWKVVFTNDASERAAAALVPARPFRRRYISGTCRSRC